MFRSDSNSEDLAGLAGAGLFDSYDLNQETERGIEYDWDSMTRNSSFRQFFMKKVGKIGCLIEVAYGSAAQDI